MPKPMVLLDPRMATSPAVIGLVAARKHRAVMVHLFAHIYVTEHGTEGFLPKRGLRFVHGRQADASALVEAGLWTATSDGWGLLDWADNQMHRPRVPVPRSMRARVFERDGFACRSCGAIEPLSIDHVLPWALGGTNDIDNLQTLCVSCNSRKRDSSPWN